MFDQAPSSNKTAPGLGIDVAGSKIETSLDKLSITWNTNDVNHKNHIRSYLFDAKDYSIKNYVKAGSSNKRYKVNVVFYPKAGGLILVQADPKKASEPFLRFEFNPTKLGPEGIWEFKFLAEPMLKHGYNTLLMEGRISRFDIAVDVHGAKLSDIMVVPGICVKSHVIASPTGEIETLYYGSSQSKSFYRIYDKAKQLNSQGVKTEGECTRIERTVRTGILLSKLPQVDNPFGKLLVTDLSFKLSGFPKGMVEFFKLATHVKGANACLAMLSKGDRKVFREAIKAQGKSWWDPKSIWTHWPEHLDELGLLTNFNGTHVKNLKPGVHFGGA